jgi:hypothetical protein
MASQAADSYLPGLAQQRNVLGLRLVGHNTILADRARQMQSKAPD